MKILKHNPLRVIKGKTYIIKRESQELYKRYGENCKVKIEGLVKEIFDENFMDQSSEPMIRFYFGRLDEIPDTDREIYLGKIDSNDVLINESEIDDEVV
jgi:hypothetical protein